MVKRYSFNLESVAEGLILQLTSVDGDGNLPKFKDVTGTETTNGIVCLGFQHVYEYNEETEESILIKEGLTYDVDVFWKDAPNKDWLSHETNPTTPNHKFA